jgi:hypothetical protein
VTVKHKGLCAALGNNVFDYGHKSAADQMRTTWEKIVHHVGTIYGQDISNELLNKKTVNLPEPAYAQAVLDKHTIKVARYATQHVRIMEASEIQRTLLQETVNVGSWYRCRRYHGTRGS